MRKNEKIYILIPSVLVFLVTITCLCGFNTVLSAHSVKEKCVHDGYHYNFKEATTLTSGHQEFWACCKCREQWLNKPEGSFMENGYTSVESTHVAYIPKIEGEYSFVKSNEDILDYYVYLNSSNNVILDDPVINPYSYDREYKLNQNYINKNNYDGNVMAQITFRILKTYSNDASIWYINQSGSYSGTKSGQVRENETVVIYANIYQNIKFRHGIKAEVIDIYFRDPYALIADDTPTELYGTYHTERNGNNCISNFTVDFDREYNYLRKVGFSSEYLTYLENKGYTSFTFNIERSGEAELTRLIYFDADGNQKETYPSNGPLTLQVVGGYPIYFDACVQLGGYAKSKIVLSHISYEKIDALELTNIPQEVGSYEYASSLGLYFRYKYLSGNNTRSPIWGNTNEKIIDAPAFKDCTSLENVDGYGLGWYEIYLAPTKLDPDDGKLWLSADSPAKIAFDASYSSKVVGRINEGFSPKTPERIQAGIFDDQYKIVIPYNASECLTYAANEIKDYYKKATTKDLSIIYDTNAFLDLNSKYISLGNTSIFNDVEIIHGHIDLSSEAMNGDGFYILNYRNSVFINANIDRGVLYGAYQLIEDSLGVKFLTDDYTHVEKFENGRQVYLYQYNEAFVPEFEQRCYLNTSVWDSSKTNDENRNYDNDKDYVSHRRFNTDFAPLGDKYGGYTLWCDYGAGITAASHSLQLILPAIDPVYCEENTWDIDEDFGKFKQIKSDYHEVWSHSDDNPTHNPRVDTDGNCDLCFTNGVTYNKNSEKSTVNLVFEKLKYWILNNPDCNYFNLGQADTDKNFCKCSYCQAELNKYKNQSHLDTNLLRSVLTIKFANEISKLTSDWIDKENIKGSDGEKRKVNFSIFAYCMTEQPPLNDNGQLFDESCRPLDNVYVKYAPIWGNHYYSLDDPRNTQNTFGVCDKWGSITNKMLSWTYHSKFSDYFWYFDSTHAMKGTLETLKRNDTIYALGQGSYTDRGSYQQYLEAYVYSKLCWDLSLDVNYLINEFLYYYFGEIAYPYIRQFHNDISFKYETLGNINPEDNIIVSSMLMSDEFWSLDYVNSLINYFDSAMEKINSSEIPDVSKQLYISHVEKGSLQPLYMRVKNVKNYFPHSETKVMEIALSFISLAEKYGVKYYGENKELSNLLKDLDIL